MRWHSDTISSEINFELQLKKCKRQNKMCNIKKMPKFVIKGLQYSVKTGTKAQIQPKRWPRNKTIECKFHIMYHSWRKMTLVVAYTQKPALFTTMLQAITCKYLSIIFKEIFFWIQVFFTLSWVVKIYFKKVLNALKWYFWYQSLWKWISI